MKENKGEEKITVDTAHEDKEDNVANISSTPSKNNKEPKGKENTEDFESKYLYLAAEMQNRERRYLKERESLVKFGQEKFALSMLETADNLERVLVNLKNDSSITEGIVMTRDNLLRALKSQGITPIDTKDVLFDPNFHEACLEQDSELEKGTVIGVLQQGYLINGRLLRACRVIISKGPLDEEGGDNAR